MCNCTERKNHVCEINIFPWSVKRGAKQNVISKAHFIVTQYIRLGNFLEKVDYRHPSRGIKKAFSTLLLTKILEKKHTSFEK